VWIGRRLLHDTDSTELGVLAGLLPGIGQELRYLYKPYSPLNISVDVEVSHGSEHKKRTTRFHRLLVKQQGGIILKYLEFYFVSTSPISSSAFEDAGKVFRKDCSGFAGAAMETPAK
jgi:hypothetical protein